LVRAKSSEAPKNLRHRFSWQAFSRPYGSVRNVHYSQHLVEFIGRQCFIDDPFRSTRPENKKLSWCWQQARRV